jgi:hypothetical protein
MPFGHGMGVGAGYGVTVTTLKSVTVVPSTLLSG